MSDIVERLRQGIKAASFNDWDFERTEADMDEEADTIIALRAEVSNLKGAARHHKEQAEALRAENERLRTALRDAFEVYAGSEDFIPETCGEGYQRQIIQQMVNIINAALEEKP